MEEKQTFLGMLYIVEALLNKGILRQDPENKDNMFIYRLADEENPEGWYSQNIHSAVSELFEDKFSTAFMIDVAKGNDIDTESLFRKANELVGGI